MGKDGLLKNQSKAIKVKIAGYDICATSYWNKNEGKEMKLKYLLMIKLTLIFHTEIKSSN